MLRLEAAVREISYFLEADGSGHAPAKCPKKPRTVEGFLWFCDVLCMSSTMFNRPYLSLTHRTNRYRLREAQQLGWRSSFRTCRFQFLS